MNWCKRYCGCHQIPERSFFIKGYQFPVCARCTGIVIGHFFVLTMAPIHIFSKKISILMIPLIIDGTTQYFTRYESNNVKRVLTGFFVWSIFYNINAEYVKHFSKIYIKKNVKYIIKNRPCANRDGLHIRRYAIKIHEYCIIFGAVMQAERLFCAGCYFYTIFA